MMGITCRLVTALPEGSRLWRATQRHRDACLNCQADTARVRSLQRDLKALNEEIGSAPGDIAPTVIAGLGDQTGADPRRELAARLAAKYAAAGVTAATIAAALATGVVKRKQRTARGLI